MGFTINKKNKPLFSDARRRCSKLGVHARFYFRWNAPVSAIGRLMMTRRCRPHGERQQTIFRARQGKNKISSVEMGCLNNFPSPAELCAQQSKGNISFGTCLFQDARKRSVLLRTVMDRPKQPANLRGELFLKFN